MIPYGKVTVKSHILPITSPICIIGSGKDCDIIIKNAAIWPKHCQIEFNQNREALRHSKRIKPELEAQRFIRAECDPPDLYSKVINAHIGRGVFAKSTIRNGTFLAHYHGTLYKADDITEKDTNFTFFFKHRGPSNCVDATEEPTSEYKPCLGRLVNHADRKTERNSKMAVTVVDNVPCLALYATREIKQDEQILYDYGKKDLPWQVAKDLSFSEQDLQTANRCTSTDIQKMDKDKSLSSDKVIKLPEGTRDIGQDKSLSSDKVIEVPEGTRDIGQDKSLSSDKVIEVPEGTRDIGQDKSLSSDNVIKLPEGTRDIDRDTSLSSDKVIEVPEGTRDIGQDKSLSSDNVIEVPEGTRDIGQDKVKYDSYSRTRTYTDSSVEYDDLSGDDSVRDPDFIQPSDSGDISSGSDSVAQESSNKQPCRKKTNTQDYVPCSDSDESTFSEIVPINIKNYEKKAVTKKTNSADSTVSPNSESEAVIIPATTAYKKDGRRNVDKRHCCVYCKTLHLRIGRHLRTHRDQEDIIALQAMSKADQDRLLCRLRLDGDYQYNVNVLSSNKGSLILPRRPSQNEYKKYTIDDYLPCEICKGFYLKKELWRHRVKCPLGTHQHCTPGRKMAQQQGFMMLQASLPSSILDKLDAGFKTHVLNAMVTDDINLIVKRDEVISKMGEGMFRKYGATQKKFIRQEMRLLARLVKELRVTRNQADGYLKDFLQPESFDFIVDAARAIAVLTEKRCASVFEIPSVAMKLGPSLKKCCIILKGQALREGDGRKERSAERFQQLIVEEWADRVTAVAIRSRKVHKRSKPELLPKSEDVLKLNAYLDKELQIAVNVLLGMTNNMDHFQRLSAILLCKLIVFNRRRSGEASKIMLHVYDYICRPDWKSDDMIMNLLTTLERKLVDRLDMIKVEGKRGRDVPVLITPAMKDALELLCRCREDVAIDPANPYLFPRANGSGYIEGHYWLRKVTTETPGMEYPERICSTKLRKFTATVVQMLNLNDGEVEWLSNHLGHTIVVHKEYYRNQESAVEMGKVANMLIQLDSGKTLLEKDNALEGHISDSDDSDFEAGVKQGSSKVEIDRQRSTGRIDTRVYDEHIDSGGSDSDSKFEAGTLTMAITSKANVGRSSNSTKSALLDDIKVEKEAIINTARDGPGRQQTERKRKYVAGHSSKEPTVVPKKRRGECQRWSDGELQALKRRFGKNIRTLTVPTKIEFMEAIQREPVLTNRDWRNVKYRVYHDIQRLRKQKT